MVRWVAVAAVLWLGGCVDRIAGGGPSEGSGSSGVAETTGSVSTSGASDTGVPPPGTDETTAESTSGSSSTGGATTGVEACEPAALPTEGGPCEPGQSCLWGDFCASGIYECIDGAWDYTITHGCGAEPVACVDGPEELNGCDETEACDPDGDCLDVLECIDGNWIARPVCNAIACPQASPRYGDPCDEPKWVCPMELECGVSREFRCSQNGYWIAASYANDPCPTPVDCDFGPMPGDPCTVEDEVCTYATPDLDPVSCTAGVWT